MDSGKPLWTRGLLLEANSLISVSSREYRGAFVRLSQHHFSFGFRWIRKFEYPIFS